MSLSVPHSTEIWAVLEQKETPRLSSGLTEAPALWLNLGLVSSNSRTTAVLLVPYPDAHCSFTSPASASTRGGNEDYSVREEE